MQRLRLQWGDVMKVNMDSNDAFMEIMEDIKRIPELTEKHEKKIMSRIRDVLVEKVKANLPRSAGAATNYDGSKPYVHMRDDIKSSVKSKGGLSSVLISGGKKTAFKWHLVNDGARDKNGNVKTVATHFVDKAVIQAEPEIENLIDELIAEVANGGGT